MIKFANAAECLRIPTPDLRALTRAFLGAKE